MKDAFVKVSTVFVSLVLGAAVGLAGGWELFGGKRHAPSEARLPPEIVKPQLLGRGYLVILGGRQDNGCMITVKTTTGDVLMSERCKPNEASKVFWDAVQDYGRRKGVGK